MPNYLRNSHIMRLKKTYFLDDDGYDFDDEDEPTFQRLRKHVGKDMSLNEDRRQANKEFGKRVNKFHKERRRNGDYHKP